MIIMTENEGFITPCTLCRCGQLVGNKECCDKIEESGLKQIVLDYLWQNIEKEHCAQYFEGICLTRKQCKKGQTYCYPIPIKSKKINRDVVVKFARWCANEAKNTADAADAAAADAAAYAADAAADAAAAVAAYAVAYAADAAAAAAADAAAADIFYFKASKEIERLIDEFGDPF